MNAKLWKQPAAEKGAQDPNDKVANNTESGTLDDLSRQPTGDGSDHQYDQETFTRYLHFRILSFFL
jgi:hypothetical protein